MSEDRISIVRVTVQTKHARVIESETFDYIDTRADLVATLRQLADEVEAECGERGLFDDEAEATEPEPYDGPRRTVHTLGQAERNGLWQCVDPPTWKAHYAWLNRHPELHDGDDSPAWHYNTGRHWSMARSGTEDTTHKTIGPLGDIDSATFIEAARMQPDGTLTYFGNDGSRWTLGAGPAIDGWQQPDGS